MTLSERSGHAEPGTGHKTKRTSVRFWLTLCSVSAAFVLFSPKLARSTWSKSLSISQVVKVSEPLPIDLGPRAAELEARAADVFTTNGRTDQVSWDSYSLALKGQRVFLHSGEFHTFRLPVPSLWLDILQKTKAAGLNSVSVYTHWGLINPSRGVIDLDGYRSLQALFDAANEAGIFIVLRPGPYINAETTAGGIAHWVTSEIAGTPRTNDTDYTESWKDYIHAIIKATVPNQITEGGPVIAVQVDNEYIQSVAGDAGYFQALEDDYHASKIVVPLTYNDAYQGGNFINGTGAVDIYGLDSYPQLFDCSHPDNWNPVTTNYHSFHESANPSQPFYSPEFQGGSFDAWGPTAPGYDACRQLTGPQFQSVFNRQLWASNAKMISYYMLYGGTSWGALPYHGVYTSYDYGSTIAENRELTTKFGELKRQGIFLRSSPEFYKTDWVVDSTTDASLVSTTSAFATVLRNPDTTASFYVLRQNDSASTATLDFKLKVTSSVGSLHLPQVVPAITLSGRESKVVVVDYAFGSSRALYSTAQVFFAGKIGNRDILYLYGDSSQAHELSLALTGKANIRSKNADVSFSNSSSGQTIVSFLAGITGLVTIWDSDKQLVLFSDIPTTETFYAPAIPGSADFKNFWQLGTNTTVLVGGPYLVRNATISGSTLAIRGDLNATTRLTVIAPSSVKQITWNGEHVSADVAATSGLTSTGGFVGTVKPSSSLTQIVAPTLSKWKYADSLPEIGANFSDASWALANHTTSNIPWKPYYTDGRILYGCDYGFCENIVLWRGHFNATGAEKSVNLSINGGEAFAASVWVNNVFLNTSYGNSTNNRNLIEETDDIFYFPKGAVKPGPNVITIVQDNMGLNETDWSIQNTIKAPRGVRGFKLDTGTFGDWKVQGKIGGYKNYLDKTRGVLNEGGLYGERKGWHLPGFDTSKWISRDISQGLPGSAAGVGFFVTTFDLNIAEGYDVPMSFNFESEVAQPYRAYLFVNGWMMGKRVANLGPQYKFPVHEGILNYHGKNTVAVALWAMENTTITPSFKVTVDGVYDGGVGGVLVNNPSWKAAGRT